MSSFSPSEGVGRARSAISSKRTWPREKSWASSAVVGEAAEEEEGVVKRETKSLKRREEEGTAAGAEEEVAEGEGDEGGKISV